MSQISEYAAFIIADIYERRVKVENSVKRLYGRRSAILHGGSQSVTANELQDALSLAKTLVIRMTTQEEIKNISSI